MGRDKGGETIREGRDRGKRQRKRDRGKETEEKRQSERDTGSACRPKMKRYRAKERRGQREGRNRGGET